MLLAVQVVAGFVNVVGFAVELTVGKIKMKKSWFVVSNTESYSQNQLQLCLAQTLLLFLFKFRYENEKE